METLLNGFTLDVPKGCFPLSTDSMLLGWFAKLPKNARVLDLGSGCGTLGLLLCARDSTCRVTGIELTHEAHRAALDNIARNALADRMESICADVRQVPSLVSPGSFTTLLSNPPYFSGGPQSSALPLARREDCCSVRELLHSAGLGAEIRRRLFPGPPPGTAGRDHRPGRGLSSGGQAAVSGAARPGQGCQSDPSAAAQGWKARACF